MTIRERLIGALNSNPGVCHTSKDGTERYIHARVSEVVDALLPLLGQPRTDVIAETIREFEDLYFGPGVQTRTWVANAMRQRHGLPPRDAGPRTDAPLDPEPWTDGTEARSPYRSGSWDVFEPRPGFEQDQARYPRTDTTETGDDHA